MWIDVDLSRGVVKSGLGVVGWRGFTLTSVGSYPLSCVVMRAGLLVVATVLAAAEVQAAGRECKYADVKAYNEAQCWSMSCLLEGSSKWAFQLADCTTLHLAHDSIGDEGARALAEALTTNTQLTELGLYLNSIGAEGARALAEARSAAFRALHKWAVASGLDASADLPILRELGVRELADLEALRGIAMADLFADRAAAKLSGFAAIANYFFPKPELSVVAKARIYKALNHKDSSFPKSEL